MLACLFVKVFFCLRYYNSSSRTDCYLSTGTTSDTLFGVLVSCARIAANTAREADDELLSLVVTAFADNLWPTPWPFVMLYAGNTDDILFGALTYEQYYIIIM